MRFVKDAWERPICHVASKHLAVIITNWVTDELKDLNVRKHQLLLNAISWLSPQSQIMCVQKFHYMIINQEFNKKHICVKDTTHHRSHDLTKLFHQYHLKLSGVEDMKSFDNMLYQTDTHTPYTQGKKNIIRCTQSLKTKHWQRQNTHRGPGRDQGCQGVCEGARESLLHNQILYADHCEV